MFSCNVALRLLFLNDYGDDEVEQNVDKEADDGGDVKDTRNANDVDGIHAQTNTQTLLVLLMLGARNQSQRMITPRTVTLSGAHRVGESIPSLDRRKRQRVVFVEILRLPNTHI